MKTRGFHVGLLIVFLAAGAWLSAQSNNPAPFVKQQYFTSNGRVAASYKLCSYAAGSTTPLSTYVSSTGSANTNPIILDASGRANVWLALGTSYKLELRAPGTDGSGTCPAGGGAGTIEWTVDNLPGGAVISTGTQNYVAKYTGAGTLGVSQITDDGADVQTPNLTFNSGILSTAKLSYDLSDHILKSLNSRNSTQASRVGHNISFLSSDTTTTSLTKAVIGGLTIGIQADAYQGFGATIFFTSQTGGMSCNFTTAGDPSFPVSSYRAMAITMAASGSTATYSQTTATATVFTQSGSGNYVTHITGYMDPSALPSSNTMSLNCGLLLNDGSTTTFRKGSWIEVF